MMWGKNNMPCICWISEFEVSEEMNQMRNHLKEAARLSRSIYGKGDLPGTDLPGGILDIKKLCHTLFDDYWEGKCSETGKDLS
jgi:hypothetical protein